MIGAMTTNVTKFFRESHHFDHLAGAVLPQLAAAARAGGRVRIWSAACSSGEEPYSIALTLLNAIPDAANLDILILASDLDPDMLARAEAGSYPAERLSDIPANLRGRHVETRRDGTFRIQDSVRSLIRFRHLNLLHDWPMPGSFDVIFCRNVMIYFDQPTQDDIWRRFAKRMRPNGTLYIGHSERIVTSGIPFTLIGQTAYRFNGGTR